MVKGNKSYYVGALVISDTFCNCFKAAIRTTGLILILSVFLNSIGIHVLPH